MQLRCRLGRPQDFADFYRNCYCLHLKDSILRSLMEHEWLTFTSLPTTLSLVVEAVSPSEQHIVGCGQVVFVSDGFVHQVQERAIPWVNVQASNPSADGAYSWLSAEQLRMANSGEGLSALITWWDFAEPPLPPEDGRRVRELLMRAFNNYSRGYKYKEILVGVTGASGLKKAQNSGFRVRCDYQSYYADHPPLPPPDKRPYLMGVSATEADLVEGSIAGNLFVYTPPRFHFSADWQYLLSQAIEGNTDEAIAQSLYLSLAAVKAQWRRIYERVQQVDPLLLPEIHERTRGAEKRSTLLRYLQLHLEELRPINTKSKTHRQRR